MRKLIVASLALWIFAGLGIALAGTAAKPKHTIKEVMKAAHKDGLLKKVSGKDATGEEKTKLLGLYIALWENSPPKGEAESWLKKTGNLVAAAGKVVVGEEGAADQLKEAADCRGCHTAHRGE